MYFIRHSVFLNLILFLVTLFPKCLSVWICLFNVDRNMRGIFHYFLYSKNKTNKQKKTVKPLPPAFEHMLSLNISFLFIYFNVGHYILILPENFRFWNQDEVQLGQEFSIFCLCVCVLVRETERERLNFFHIEVYLAK